MYTFTIIRTLSLIGDSGHYDLLYTEGDLKQVKGPNATVSPQAGRAGTDTIEVRMNHGFPAYSFPEPVDYQGLPGFDPNASFCSDQGYPQFDPNVPFNPHDTLFSPDQVGGQPIMHPQHNEYCMDLPPAIVHNSRQGEDPVSEDDTTAKSSSRRGKKSKTSQSKRTSRRIPAAAFSEPAEAVAPKPEAEPGIKVERGTAPKVLPLRQQQTHNKPENLNWNPRTTCQKDYDTAATSSRYLYPLI